MLSLAEFCVCAQKCSLFATQDLDIFIIADVRSTTGGYIFSLSVHRGGAGGVVHGLFFFNFKVLGTFRQKG